MQEDRNKSPLDGFVFGQENRPNCWPLDIPFNLRSLTHTTDVIRLKSLLVALGPESGVDADAFKSIPPRSTLLGYSLSQLREIVTSCEMACVSFDRKLVGA